MKTPRAGTKPITPAQTRGGRRDREARELERAADRSYRHAPHADLVRGQSETGPGFVRDDGRNSAGPLAIRKEWK